MQKEEIINILKRQYSRNLRKQLVKTILNNEKDLSGTTVEQQYRLIDQIFSYVIKECNWSMSQNSQEWDDTPLEIMKEIFPKLDTTQWYKDHDMSVKKNIDVVVSRKKQS